MAKVRILPTSAFAASMKRASSGAAAVDCYACITEKVVIYPGESTMIDLGFKMEIADPDVCAVLLPRSGLGTKGIVLRNLVGLIDSDYRGPVKACIWNTDPNDEFVINPHDRICQMMFLPVIQPEFEIVEELGVSDRGEGGFGSSGVSVH